MPVGEKLLPGAVTVAVSSKDPPGSIAAAETWVVIVGPAIRTLTVSAPQPVEAGA